MIVLVGLPDIFGYPKAGDDVARLEGVQVSALFSVGVELDRQLDKPGLVQRVGGCVRPDHGSPPAVRRGKRDSQESGAEGKAARLIRIWKLKAELLGVVVDDLGAVQLEGAESEAAEVWLCGVAAGTRGRRGGSCSGTASHVHIGANANSGGCESDLGRHYFGASRC